MLAFAFVFEVVFVLELFTFACVFALDVVEFELALFAELRVVLVDRSVLVVEGTCS